MKIKYQEAYGPTFISQELLAVPTQDTYCLIDMKIMRMSPTLQQFKVDGHFIYPGMLVIHVPPKKS